MDIEYLSEYLEFIDVEKDDFQQYNADKVKCLAIMLLKKINRAISRCIGTNYQVGHSVFWDLADDCSLGDVIKVVDLIIIPQIEEYCYDVIDGLHDDYLNLQIGNAFIGEDSIQQAINRGKKIHSMHEELHELNQNR